MGELLGKMESRFLKIDKLDEQLKKVPRRYKQKLKHKWQNLNKKLLSKKELIDFVGNDFARWK